MATLQNRYNKWRAKVRLPKRLQHRYDGREFLQATMTSLNKQAAKAEAATWESGIRAEWAAMETKCYANQLGDCSGKLSREHFISRAILETAQPDLKKILLGGALDIGVPTGAQNLAVSKMLCTKHNSELSALDSEAKRLCSTLFDWNSLGGMVEETFDGETLVRWQMKSLLGTVTAQKLTDNFSNQPSFQEVCKWAFGREPVPAQIGMTVPNELTPFPSAAIRDGGCPPWVVSLQADPFGSFFGYRTWFYPLEFNLDLRGAPSISQTVRFKPARVELVSQQRESHLALNFSWKGWSGGTIVYKLD